MEATTLFPVLLAFMVAVLSALGYALHRIADTSPSNEASAVPCAQCGELVSLSAGSCPACGTRRQNASVTAYEGPTASAGVRSRGSAS